MGVRADHRPWTPGDDAALRACVADGLTYREAAAELGRTYPAVKFRARVLGVGRPCGHPPDVDRRVRVLGLVRAGHTISAAARVLGIGRPTAQGLARRMARDGLLRRVGAHPHGVRYVPA